MIKKKKTIIIPICFFFCYYDVCLYIGNFANDKWNNQSTVITITPRQLGQVQYNYYRWKPVRDNYIINITDFSYSDHLS